MKDLLISCLSNYSVQQIAPWVKSIINSGFSGDKVILSYGIPETTKEFLIQSGFSIYHTEPSDRHIVVDRFFAMWEFLVKSTNDYRYVITTDVKDVIFQYNPSNWLETNLKGQILISSENIQYKHESWGNENLFVSYPHLYELNKNNIIYNAGTIAGEVSFMKDFFLHIFHLSLVGADRQPDQAALNILAHTYPFKNIVHFAQQEEGWCCQLGTTLDPKIKSLYKGYLLEPIPKVVDSVVVNSENIPFCLVHQYDRVPELKDIIFQKYQ